MGVVGGAEGDFFEEDEDPAAVARLAAMFARKPRFMEDEGHLVAVVQTIRRQSERTVREGIVSDLRGALELLKTTAREVESFGWPDSERDAWRARLQEMARAAWIAAGRPGRGISYVSRLDYPLPGHPRLRLHGIPAGGPVGFAVGCECDPEKPWSHEWGWSPTVIGAKRLARRHAGLL